MRYQGRLTSWEENRGFGFIEWNGGSDKLFVHISAFTDRQHKPSVGDILTYEAIKDSQGRFKADKVAFVRSATGASRRSSRTASAPASSGFRWARLAPLALLAVIGAALQWQSRSTPEPLPVEAGQQRSQSLLERAPNRTTAASRFSCDGKTHCSEMSSCEEAVFYLQHCPGSVTDGDGDGRPCEDQWCGH